MLGFGWQKGDGVRAGGITDIERAERVIRAAVGAAEEMADTRLRSITVNLSCGQPESRLFNVQWPVGGRAVTEADIRRVLLEGRARALSEGREIIHALPLAFTDGRRCRASPIRAGCIATRSPRGCMCVDAITTALRTLGACMARCDLDIAELVSAPMAAGMATLVEDEKPARCDGARHGRRDDREWRCSRKASFCTPAQLPVGGVHVTSDIARVLSTPIGHAERLKTLYGSAQASPDDEREMLPVPLVGEEEHQIAKVPRSMVVNIIKPRLEETFEMVKERLEGSGLGRAAGTRVVLTGGASQLPARAKWPRGFSAGRCGTGVPLHCAACRKAPAVRPSRPPSGCSPGRPAKAARCTTSISTRIARAAWVRRVVNFLRERV